MTFQCEERDNVTPDELIYLHNHKTGADQSRCRCGCLCGGVNQNEKTEEILDSYAQSLGLAFQIKDDILDVTGDEKLLGSR